MLNETVKFRTTTDFVEKVDEIADRNGFDRSEVLRRLTLLGIDDIEQIGDEALLVPGPDPCLSEEVAD